MGKLTIFAISMMTDRYEVKQFMAEDGSFQCTL